MFVFCKHAKLQGLISINADFIMGLGPHWISYCLFLGLDLLIGSGSSSWFLLVGRRLSRYNGCKARLVVHSKRTG